MKMKDSVIWAIHENKEVLEHPRRKSIQTILIATWVVNFFSLTNLIRMGSAWSQEPVSWSIASTFLLLIPTAWFWAYKIPEYEVRNDIKMVASELLTTVENLLSKNYDYLKGISERAVIEYAIDITLLEEEGRKLIYLTTRATNSPTLKEMVRQGLADEHASLKDRLEFAYNLLRKFNVVPDGGYQWAFDRAKEEITARKRRV